MADKDLHARLVIYDLPTMSRAEVKSLENWLQQKLDEIRTCKQLDYASRYTSRLFK